MKNEYFQENLENRIKITTHNEVGAFSSSVSCFFHCKCVGALAKVSNRALDETIGGTYSPPLCPPFACFDSSSYYAIGMKIRTAFPVIIV